MTKTEIVSLFKVALCSVGYDEARIRRNYDFSDLTGDTAQVRNIPLAAFGGYPQSYRNARIGVLFTDDTPAAITDYRALGAPLLMTVRNETVQPWAVGIDGGTEAGKPFRLADIDRVFQKNSSSWGQAAMGRLKVAGAFSAERQPEIFDTGLVPALEARFQIRLKELLERSFQVIFSTYREVHRRPPRVNDLFAFLFRFVTAKIFMDRADATGWEGLDNAHEVLRAAERQTGLLEKPDSEFLRKPILEKAWDIVKSTLHFQNLSVPDLAFVAESAFITDETRDELGVHSTPAGLADYVVKQLPWNEVPVDERVVFEAFCGHGIFLAKAMERLGQDLPGNLGPKARHEYFRKRLIGIETDPLSLEICRLVLTLSDYPNGNSWEGLHRGDVFNWPDWDPTLQSATVMLANPPYEAFPNKYRQQINAVKTKPPAEFLFRLLRTPPRLLGLVLPQSFLSDPIYQDANRLMARRYGSINVVELPRIFRYANNETVAVMASGLRAEGRTVRVHYSEVHKDGIDRFFEDWHVSATRSADVPVPPASGGPRFTLRLLPVMSIFPTTKNKLKLGDISEIRQGVHWIKRTDGKQMSAPRSDVATDKEKEGFRRGAEKMNGNLSQFQLRATRYLSLLDKDQDPSTRANKRQWEKRKAVCNAARLQIDSPWRLAAWADEEGLAFTKQFFAIWPKEGVSEFAIAAILASPVANAFSFERDLDRHNHIETLRQIPVPELEELQPNGELHRRAAELQSIMKVRDFAQPPTTETVTAAAMRLDAAVLDAYGFSAAVQFQLLKMFNGWPRPLPPPYGAAFVRYFPEDLEEEVRLSDLIAVTADWQLTNHRRHELLQKRRDRTISNDERAELQHLQHLAGLKTDLLSSPSRKELEKIEKDLRRRGLWQGA